MNSKKKSQLHLNFTEEGGFLVFHKESSPNIVYSKGCSILQEDSKITPISKKVHLEQIMGSSDRIVAVNLIPDNCFPLKDLPLVSCFSTIIKEGDLFTQEKQTNLSALFHIFENSYFGTIENSYTRTEDPIQYFSAGEKTPREIPFYQLKLR